MSYGELKYMRQTNRYGGTWRVSLMEKDFTGAADEISGENFRKKYTLSDERNLFEQKIIEHVIEWDVIVQSEAEETFYKSLRNVSDSEYKLRIQLDGADDIEGFLKPGMVSIAEGGRPKRVTLRAKPLPFKNDDYPLQSESEYSNLITAIAGILDSALPIYTYNDLQIETQSDDFFHEAKVDLHHLRKYRGSSSQDTAISNEQALKELLPTGCALMQHSGAWHIYYLPYIARNQNPTRYAYTSAGSQSGSTTVDLVKSLSGKNHMLPSVSRFYEGLKFINQAFDHQTLLSTLSFDPSYINTNNAQVKTERFTIDGLEGQRVRLEGKARIEFSGSTTAGQAHFTLRVGQYYWDLLGNQWTVTETENNINCQGQNSLEGEILFVTTPIPVDLEDTTQVNADEVRIDFLWASSTATVEQVEFYNFSGRVSAPTGDSASIDYRLSQASDYPGVLDLEPRIFGQGPASFARSAYRYLATNAVADEFRIRGGSGQDWAGLSLSQIMSSQRTGLRVGRFSLLSQFQIGDVVSHDGSLFFLLAGGFDGKNQTWDSRAIELNFDSGSYTLREVENLEGVSGGTGSGAAPSPSDGLTETQANVLYLRKDGNLDGLSDVDGALINLSLQSGVKTLDLSGVDIAGSELVDSSRNVTANTARVDTGRLLSPTDYRLETATTGSLRKVEFAQATEATHGVTGGRQLTLNPDTDGVITWDSGTQNLTNDRTWTPTIADHGEGQRGVLNTAPQSIYGEKAFQNAATFESNIVLDNNSSQVNSKTFAGGFAGSGMRWNPVNGQWELTTDNLVVRNRARFYELVIERIRSVGGTLIINEGMKVEEVEQVGDGSWQWDDDIDPFQADSFDMTFDETFENSDKPYAFADQWRCYTEEDMRIEFTEHDLVKRQEFTGRGVGVTDGTVFNIEFGSTEATDNSIRRYFDIYLETNSDAPVDGSDFVRIGSRFDAERMNGIVITSSDTGNPYRRVYAGVDRHDKFGSFDTLISQDGRLDNIIDPLFTDLDGTQENLFGSWLKNLFARDNVFISLSGGEMKFGRDADGQGNDGLYIDEDNYFLLGRGFKATVGGEVTQENILSTINVSEEGIDIKGDRIQLTGDTSIDGSFNVTGDNITLTGADITLNGDTNVQGSFEVSGGNITLDGDVTITGGFTLNGSAIVDGTLEAKKLDVTSLSAVSGSMGALTVDNTLTMASGGKITNQDDDFSISASGLSFLEGNERLSRSVVFRSSSGDVRGMLTTDQLQEDLLLHTPIGSPYAVTVMSSNNVNITSGENIDLAGKFMLPRYTTTERDNLSAVANGTLIFNTTTQEAQLRRSGSWTSI